MFECVQWLRPPGKSSAKQPDRTLYFSSESHASKCEEGKLVVIVGRAVLALLGEHMAGPWSAMEDLTVVIMRADDGCAAVAAERARRDVRSGATGRMQEKEICNQAKPPTHSRHRRARRTSSSWSNMATTNTSSTLNSSSVACGATENDDHQRWGAH